MSYASIADITTSYSLRQRLTACAAQEGKSRPYSAWVEERIWEIAKSPGWGEKWASAMVNPEIKDPGADESVITDGDILSTVSQMS